MGEERKRREAVNVLKKQFPILLIFISLPFFVVTANAVIISNVVVSDGNKAIVDESLQVGDKAFSDRDYTFGEIPEKCLGLPFIRTPMNSSKTPIEPDLEISFEVDKEAYVYLVWAEKEPLAKWLMDDYEDTGDIIMMGKDMQQWPDLQKRHVWRSEKIFKPGKVTTYEVTQDAAIYIILVEQTVYAVFSNGKLATSWGRLKVR